MLQSVEFGGKVFPLKLKAGVQILELKLRALLLSAESNLTSFESKIA
jgi:hypothetical protein